MRQLVQDHTANEQESQNYLDSSVYLLKDPLLVQKKIQKKQRNKEIEEMDNIGDSVLTFKRKISLK